MAINKSNFTESFGGNIATRIGYMAAGVVGFGAAVLGVINVGRSLKLDEAVDAFFDWDTLRATAAAVGGGLILSSVYNKVKYPDDPNKAQIRHVNLALGGILVGGSLLTYAVFDNDTSKSETVVTVDQTSQSTTGSTITSTPPGMCEINIPYLSEDTPSVLKMQAALNEGGFGIIHVDGINGPQTKTALSNFKVANGFDPAIDFNAEMCALMPSLVDGNPDTPVTMAGS